MNKLTRRLSKLNWKYVIGELLLIVSGILIALFLNNLNEERKLKNFEEKIIAEIDISLKSDFNAHIDSRIERGNNIFQSADIVLDFLDNRIDYHDSLGSHFWKLNRVIIFEPQTIPFERLKSKGIEYLSNESTRLKLLELYDFTYPRMEYFTENYNNWTTNRIEPFCLKHFIINELKRGKTYTPINIQQIVNSMEFRNLVIEKRSKTRRLIGHMERAKDEVEKLLEELNK